jgi:hypothetical protein
VPPASLAKQAVVGSAPAPLLNQRIHPFTHSDATARDPFSKMTDGSLGDTLSENAMCLSKSENQRTEDDEKTLCDCCFSASARRVLDGTTGTE